jgi:hypothetical protein
VAYCGSNQCSTVTVDSSTIICPTGISATVSNSGSSAVTIKFTTTATISTACEATIPITVDGITINKKFSFAVAKTGATGAKGATGAAGSDGVGISSMTTYYLTTNSASGVTTSTSGWSTTPTATSTSKKYIWSYTKTTYTDNTTSNSTPAIIGTHGATGAAGADAITVSITSSNGTVFKNSSGSTVLTAHVYYAGVECTISTAGAVTSSSGSSLGTIKWYKGTSTTAVATANTLTVSASDVDNVAAYTCQLEA